MAGFILFMLIIIYALLPIILVAIIIAVVIVFLSYVIAVWTEPQSVRNGYLRDDEGWKLGLRIYRLFSKKDDIPIWVIPEERIISNVEADLLRRANLLYDESKVTIKRLRFAKRIKKKLLRQIALIPQNIANALWKLANLKKIQLASDYLSFTKEHINQNKELQNQVITEMESSIQYLSSLSLLLIKSEMLGDNKVINELLAEISTQNSRLRKIVASDANSFNKIPASFTSLIGNFFLIVLLLSSVSLYAPEYAFPIIIIGSILSFVVTGVFQMLRDGNIRESSFVKIVIEILRGLRILK